MIRLHAIWSNAMLHLWGEGEEGREASAPLSPAEGKIPGHPNALSPSELHAAVGDLSPDGLLASIADESELSLWLPCVADRPCPSTHSRTTGFHAALSREDSADGENSGKKTCQPVPLGPAVKAWQPTQAAAPTTVERTETSANGNAPPASLQQVCVPTLAFSGADSVDILTSVPPAMLRTCQDSLRFWSHAARVVLSLLARRQFVPELSDRGDNTFAAHWRVFAPNSEESTWLEDFAKRMPPICRSVVGDAITTADPAKLVDSFLTMTADAVIRRDLANDPFFNQIHHRAEKEPCWQLHWLSGLIGDSQPVNGDAEEMAAVSAEVHAWLGTLDVGAPTHLPQLGFRLIEPEDVPEADDATWRVSLEVHDPDTGSLLDIPRIWSEHADETPTILGRRMLDHRKHLLSELDRAKQVFPNLEDAISADGPKDVHLTTAAVHSFLREWAPLLSAQGFSVSLPDWATGHGHRLGMKLFVRPQDADIANNDESRHTEISLGSFGLSSLLDFDWRVAVGDDQLSLEEFEAVVRQESSLVRIRDHWVNIEHDAAAQALEFMRQKPSGKMSLVEAMRLAGGAEELNAGLPILGLSGESWIEQLLRETDDVRMESVEQPTDFVGELRPYQRRGLEWLAFLDRLGVGACLADDMGLGKTIQLIALLLHERRNGRVVGPTLLLVPMSLIGNWAREIQRFTKTLRALVHHGPERLAGAAFVKAASRHDVVITTYGLAHRELKSLNHVPWHRIALDEAQKIKNPSANQTIAVRSLRAPHRLALTGTPLENHLSELWSIVEMLNPGLLGSAASFRKRYAIPVEKFGNEERADQLRRLIRPFILRRLKNDPEIACDLPEKMEMRVFCNLTPEQATWYKHIVSELLGEVEATSGIQRRGMILATLTKLKQVCNHPAHYQGTSGNLNHRSGKCERLVEMLEEVIEEGDSAIVFTQVRKMGNLLQQFLTDRLQTEVLFLHGGSSSKNREQMIQRFQDPASGIRVFILSLRAGGFGLNLTQANHVFHFDRWWNPAVEDQATDRAHRIGQNRKVQVHKFVCAGTIEERIDKVLTEKAALTDRIVGTGDDWLTGLSTAELQEHFKLSSDAVAETL